MNINIELYKVFYCVAKNRSITNAAKELFITQPAVSQSIRLLEQQLGGRLFVRLSHGVELTEEGQAIYEYVERSISLLDEAQNKFNQMKNLILGTIRIAASDNICKNFLMPYISLYRKMYPDVRMQIYNGTSSRSVQLLRNGKADIGFVNMPFFDDEVEVNECYHMRDCFVCGKEYANLKQMPLTAKDLCHYPLILLEKGTNSRALIDEYFKSNGEVCDPEIEVASHDLMVILAKSSLGIACVTEQYVKNELASGDLIKLDIKTPIRSRSLGYCKIKNAPLNFASKKFIELIDDDNRVLI